MYEYDLNEHNFQDLASSKIDAISEAIYENVWKIKDKNYEYNVFFDDIEEPRVMTVAILQDGVSNKLENQALFLGGDYKRLVNEVAIGSVDVKVSAEEDPDYDMESVPFRRGRDIDVNIGCVYVDFNVDKNSYEGHPFYQKRVLAVAKAIEENMSGMPVGLYSGVQYDEYDDYVVPNSSMVINESQIAGYINRFKAALAKIEYKIELAEERAEHQHELESAPEVINVR